MRHPHWEQRLSALISSWHNQPFVWGKHDCAQFALAVLTAVSAKDWTQVSVQPYRTARGAKAMLTRLGVADMAELADKMLGSRIPIGFARRGDLVTCPGPYGPALGVCLGSHAALPGSGGLLFRPINDVFACWRI